MFENLSVFENRYEELNMKLYDPAVAADRNLYRDLMKEHKEIEPIVEKYRALKKAEASLEDAEAILNDSEADKELRQMASDEMSAAKSDIESISEELKILLLPRINRPELERIWKDTERILAEHAFVHDHKFPSLQAIVDYRKGLSQQ
ncbi:PCRF domain-containing protein, partial [Hominenteromicrobium sp.]|uniref:PCRF domain-containing protein n=1 Tax=Hominenteromicrobium sp. TaxID=3073581 RepID=UPI003A90E754